MVSRMRTEVFSLHNHGIIIAVPEFKNPIKSARVRRIFQNNDLKTTLANNKRLNSVKFNTLTLVQN